MRLLCSGFRSSFDEDRGAWFRCSPVAGKTLLDVEDENQSSDCLLLEFWLVRDRLEVGDLKLWNSGCLYPKLDYSLLKLGLRCICYKGPR